MAVVVLNTNLPTTPLEPAVPSSTCPPEVSAVRIALLEAFCTTKAVAEALVLIVIAELVTLPMLMVLPLVVPMLMVPVVPLSRDRVDEAAVS